MEKVVVPSHIPPIEVPKYAGLACMEHGDFVEAARLLRIYVSHNGADTEAHRVLGEAYIKLGQFNLALNHMTIVSHHTGDRAPLHRLMEGTRILPIFTALRTGTWWNVYFFYFYDSFLKGVTEPPMPVRTEMFFDYRKSINGLLTISHGACPGYEDNGFPTVEKWRSLTFSLEGYNYSDSAVRTLYDFFDVSTPSNPGIVYLYRNPLDHFVSMFQKSSQNLASVDPSYAGDRDVDGNLIDYSDLFGLVKTHLLDCFIKQFLTFKEMETKFPKKVLMQSYEEHMTRDPERYFRRVFGFFEIPINEEAFAFALNRSSRDSMRELEKTAGVAIGGNGQGARHGSDGATGKWRKYLTESEVDYIEARFQEFGMSIYDFKLT